MAPRVFHIGLAAAVGVGLLVRLAMIASPLGEIDADEAVVGLMSRHIAFLGERPVFYWGQPYLGSLEAFSVAPLVRVFDSSTPLLKLVPTLYGLGFLVLSAILARRLFGIGAGLATAAYLAVPPAMWAVWSTKARGGYAELLFLGEAVLLATLALAQSRSRRLALLWGILAGLAFWTHPLAIVYVLPAVLFLLLGRRMRWSAAELALTLVGGLVGMLPLLIQNVGDGFRTVAALVQEPDLPIEPGAQFVRFFRVGVPVLLGLGQPTTSEALYDLDWLHRPAGQLWVAAVALLVVGAAVLAFVPSLRCLLRRGADRACEPALLLLLAAIAPPVIALTRFGVLVSEPRYALPMYSAVPLLAGALWLASMRAPRPHVLRWAVVGAVLAFNVWSVLTSDPRLWRPEDMPDTTAATRSVLVQHLVGQDRHQIYTDYWIAYPVMFDSREEVLAYVVSGGYNRYLPPADNVQRTSNPAWVFTPGTDSERAFLDQLAALGGRAQVADVSVYRVYTDVQPLAAMRP
jgi:4-amino-4-deoxy-L-arabinose transferase-like glycosyltransferase